MSANDPKQTFNASATMLPHASGLVFRMTRRPLPGATGSTHAALAFTEGTIMKVILAISAAIAVAGALAPPVNAAVYRGHHYAYRYGGYHGHRSCHWHAGRKICR